MKNLKKLLLAAALLAAAVATAPAKTEATDWCATCAASGYTHCYSCCRCDGGGSSYCINICGAP